MTDIRIANDYAVKDRETVTKLLEMGLGNRLRAFHFTPDDIDRLSIVLADYLLQDQPTALTLARVNEKICGLLLINRDANQASVFLKKLRQTVSLKLTMQFSFFLWVINHQVSHFKTTTVELLAVANDFKNSGLETKLLQFASEQLPADEHLTLYTNNPSASDNDRYEALGFQPISFEEPRQIRHLNNWRHWVFSNHNLNSI